MSPVSLSLVSRLVRCGPPPSPACFPASAKVREQHYDQVGGEPDVVVAHILVDVDQDQDTRRKYAEQDVGPLRDGVRRERRRKHHEIHQHHEPRKKERK